MLFIRLKSGREARWFIGRVFGFRSKISCLKETNMYAVLFLEQYKFTPHSTGASAPYQRATL